jgi:hypothetical protein
MQPFIHHLSEFISDRVNLVNIALGFAACWLKYIAQASAVVSLVTPLVLFVSAVCVCAYNAVKFYRILKNKK